MTLVNPYSPGLNLFCQIGNSRLNKSGVKSQITVPLSGVPEGAILSFHLFSLLINSASFVLIHAKKNTVP